MLESGARGYRTQSQVCDGVSGHLQFSQKTQISSLLVGELWRAMGPYAEQKPSRTSQGLCKRVELGKTFWDRRKELTALLPQGCMFLPRSSLISCGLRHTAGLPFITVCQRAMAVLICHLPLPMAILQRNMGNEELGKLKKIKEPRNHDYPLITHPHSFSWPPALSPYLALIDRYS